MRLLIQRVTQASVTVNSFTIGSIGQGLLVFIGITHGDTAKEAKWLADKLGDLRIFEDENGKMNRSLIELGYEVLVVSQFTLYADCSAGRRPSFVKAAPAELAESLYELFIQELKQKGINTHTGSFGASMQVTLTNSGPVTIIIET